MSEHVLPYQRPEYQRDEARLIAANTRIGKLLSAHAGIERTVLEATQSHPLDIDLYHDDIAPALAVAGIDVGNDYGFPVAAIQPVPTETFILTDRYARMMTTEQSPDVPRVVSLHAGISILRVMHEAPRPAQPQGAELLYGVSGMDQGDVFLCASDTGDSRDISMRMEVYPEMYAYYEASIAVLRFTTAKSVNLFTGAA